MTLKSSESLYDPHSSYLDGKILCFYSLDPFI